MIHKCHEMHRWSHLYPTHRQRGIWKVQLKNYWPNQKKSPTQLSFISRGSGGTWQRCHPGVTLAPARSCGAWESTAGQEDRRWFKGEITFGALISLGQALTALGHEEQVLLLERISVPCPHWDAETRGARTWDNAQALLDLFPSFPPALEFSTLFILN